MSSDQFDLVRLISDYKHDVVMSMILEGESDPVAIAEELHMEEAIVLDVLDTLHTHDFITERDGRYVPTIYGLLTFEEYLLGKNDVRKALGVVDDFTSYLDELPPADAIDAVVLDGAVIERPKPGAPLDPMQYLDELIRAASNVRGLLVQYDFSIMTALADQISVDELTAEIVTAPRLTTYLRENPIVTFPLEELLVEDRFALYDAADVLPFGMIIVDEPTPLVGVIVYQPTNGRPRIELHSVLLNNSPDAVKWAITTFQAYQADATKVPCM